jgi:predicted NUDIX family NTP pyrophosphohydrolase
MPKESAGLLVYRKNSGRLEFLLAHPGGPFWRNKDAGAWTIPKGEIQAGEEPLMAARREFKEELGTDVLGGLIELSPIKQKAGKIVRAWAIEADLDLTTVKSNTFSLEWPPRSGRTVEFAEVDRVAYFDFETAQEKINPGQISFLEQVRSLRKDS